MKPERVIVVGAGLSGLATALGVALLGGEATVYEAADLVGGAAAYSGGQVWVGANHVAERQGIDDDLERAERYVRDIAHDHPELLDESAMLRWLAVSPEATRYWEEVGAIRWTVIPGLADYHNEADGALEEGRYLTNEVIDGSALGEWRDKLRVSPFFPVGTTYADMFVKGRRLTGFGVSDDGEDEAAPKDPLTFGTGVVASFLARVLQEDAIEIKTGAPVTGLLTEDGAVVGVRHRGHRAARPRRARHEHLRLGPRARARVPGPRARGLRQRRPEQPARRRDQAGPRGRRGHGHDPRDERPDPARLACRRRLRIRPRVRDAARDHRRRRRQPVLRRLLLGRHRRQDARPRQPPSAVLSDLGRAAPRAVRPGRDRPGRGIRRRRWASRARRR